MKRGGTLVLVGATALAAPVALVFESVLRWLLFPPEFESVRAMLAPFLTPLAWLLVLLSAIAGLAGALLQKRLVAARIAKVDPAASDAERAARIEAIRNQVFLVTSSIPQLPTIASTFAFMFGASVVPTLVGVVVCTVAVLAQGVISMAGTMGGTR